MRSRTLASIFTVLTVAALCAGRTTDPRARIFVQHGCSECHAIAALDVHATSDVGPDLTFAYADVVNRYGTSLASFLDDPPGMMGFVLTAHLHVTQADRDSISHILYAVYREHLADMDREMPSFPPARVHPAAPHRSEAP